MMSPLSGLVLGSASIVSAPALWAATVEGTLPIDVALTRFLAAVLVCWVALSMFGGLLSEPTTSGEPHAAAPEAKPPASASRTTQPAPRSTAPEVPEPAASAGSGDSADSAEPAADAQSHPTDSGLTSV